MAIIHFGHINWCVFWSHKPGSVSQHLMNGLIEVKLRQTFEAFEEATSYHMCYSEKFKCSLTSLGITQTKEFANARKAAIKSITHSIECNRLYFNVHLILVDGI